MPEDELLQRLQLQAAAQHALQQAGTQGMLTVMGPAEPSVAEERIARGEQAQSGVEHRAPSPRQRALHAQPPRSSLARSKQCHAWPCRLTCTVGMRGSVQPSTMPWFTNQVSLRLDSTVYTKDSLRWQDEHTKLLQLWSTRCAWTARFSQRTAYTGAVRRDGVKMASSWFQM